MSIDVSVGESASAEALAHLRGAAGAKDMEPALAALDAQAFARALALANRAIGADPRNAQAWRIAAIAHENLGHHHEALDAYQTAFERSGQDPALAGDIGRLALRMGLHEIAEQLLRLYLAAEPGSLDGRINLAHALREQHLYDDAVAVLKPALEACPEDAALWTSLGVVLVQRGDVPTALVFLNEALRLRPGYGRALYYRANAASDLGDQSAAIADFAAALAGGALAEADRERVRFAMALSYLAMGALGEGWDAYRARLSPLAAAPVRFDVDAPAFPFDPDTVGALAGLSLLIIAEQGLGDEVMFANTLPDVVQALGPSGRLTIAVERRLAALFARSFPRARVIAHETEKTGALAVRAAPTLDEPLDAWAPMAAPARLFRRTVEAFPARDRFLIPDPARVAHWRARLAALPGRKVGILWKSLKLTGERLRQFAPFDLWAPVLRTPGVTVVNLQYGDCAEELDHARDVLGVEIWQPLGLDLKEDLDDVAALTCALDLTIGFANATINLAGACGAPAWLITPGASWTKLGTDGYPWYPQVRCFSAAEAGGWEAVMAQAAAALRSA